MPPCSPFGGLTLLFALLLTACNDPNKETQQSAPTASSGQSAAAEEETLEQHDKNEPIALSAADFHTDRVLEGLSPEAKRLGTEKKASPFGEKGQSDATHPQRRFTRVKGGNDFYCGATFEGPIICWGKRNESIDGKFIDLAIAGDELCWIDTANQLSCDKVETPPGFFSRVQASGNNFCALQTNGGVKCWGKDSTQPISGLKAEFIAVGDHFACAADITRRLVCWGETLPLMLPIDALRVRDIAAGSEFLCAVDEDKTAKCFGQGPRLPEGQYTTVNANFEQVCAIGINGKNTCVGSIDETFTGQTRRFAIAKRSICAHLMKNELNCKGSDVSRQLRIPLDTTKTLSATGIKPTEVDPNTWLKFIELFPERKPPYEFLWKSKVTLGDRLGPEFEPILNEDPNRYRTGVGFDFGAGVLGFTLFDLNKRALRLFLFRDRRKVEAFTLLEANSKDGELIEADDGTAALQKTARSRESIITKDLTIEVTELEGTEKRTLVKKHQDGSRPVSSIDCQIQKSTWVSTVDDKGQSSRQHARVKRAYGAVDQVGCAGRAPFSTGPTP